MVISAKKYDAMENRIKELSFKNTGGWYPSVEELDKYIGKDSTDIEDAQLVLWYQLTTPKEIQNAPENQAAKAWITDFLLNSLEIQESDKLTTDDLMELMGHKTKDPASAKKAKSSKKSKKKK